VARAKKLRESQASFYDMKGNGCYELLVDAKAFSRRLDSDIRAAQKRVSLQAMTFEGDASGQQVAEAIMASRAKDRRILVDAYTRFTLSDKFLYGPTRLCDNELQAEVKATQTMFSDLGQHGVGVRVTNPYGPLMLRRPARNHKKLMVIDDRIAYLGGINFSDHNFTWNDLMVRIEDSKIALHLAKDFDSTWNGEPQASVATFRDAEIYSLDGVSNPKMLRGLWKLVEQAQRSIHVLSPYLTFPFTEALRNATERGVTVTLLTPEANNKPIVRDYLLWVARRSGFDVCLQKKMSHLKALLVDNRALVVGSSNFDIMSHYAQEEFVAVLREPKLIASFSENILLPNLAAARSLDFAISSSRGWTCYLLLKLGEVATRFILALIGRGRRRVVPW
jgi:cardiolipin synthase